MNISEKINPSSPSSHHPNDNFPTFPKPLDWLDNLPDFPLGFSDLIWPGAKIRGASETAPTSAAALAAFSRPK